MLRVDASPSGSKENHILHRTVYTQAAEIGSHCSYSTSDDGLVAQGAGEDL
jgi:hypothetical protein